MTTRNNLIVALQQTLNRVASNPMRTLLNNQADHSAYEVYIFSLILKSIKNIAENNEIILKI